MKRRDTSAPVPSSPAGAGESVVVAMSGGVDSSVAAALLVESGYRVVGVTLRLWCYGETATLQPASKTCCSLEDIADARRVADRLGIRHYVLDMRDDFEERVVAPFVDAYARGRTPNPCVECNTHLKFGQLLEFADGIGAGSIATGHYARRIADADGAAAIYRGADSGKDQSYVLWGIRRAVLDRVLLPVGELDKSSVRTLATELGLAVAAKPDSQDICFVPEGRYVDFVRDRLEAKSVAPGPIVDGDGAVLGQHDGVIGYTVGQRRGLGLAASEPLYVIAIEPDSRTVRVGPAAALAAGGLVAHQPNRLTAEALRPGEVVMVQVRAGHLAHAARIVTANENRIEVDFEEPVRAVVPGQSVAFYDGERLLGGGVIEFGLPVAGPA